SATLSATAAKNQPRSAVRIRSCRRSSVPLFAFGIACMLWQAVVELRAQALVEEAAEQEHRADSKEREGPLHGTEARQVVEEDLAEADREQDEPPDAEHAAALLQTDVEGNERKQSPERAHD